MSLTSVLSSIEKKYKDTIVDLSDMKSTLQYTFLSSPQLNYALGGAFVDGRIYEFHGPESSGKTLMAMKIANDIQKRKDKNVIVFVDHEKTFSIQFYKKVFPEMSFDRKHFIYLDPLDGETSYDIIEELIKTNEIGLVIVDSVASMPTRSQLAAENGKADFGGTAKLMAAGLKKINPYISRFKTSIIFINQVRAAIDAYSFESIPGGRALPFYASVRFRVSRIEDITEKGIIVGLRLKMVNKKNKIGIPKRTAEFSFKFGEGFDVMAEYIDFFIQLGLVEAKGAWIKCEKYNINVNGRAKLLEWLQLSENIETYNVFVNTTNAMLMDIVASDEVNENTDEFQESAMNIESDS